MINIPFLVIEPESFYSDLERTKVLANLVKILRVSMVFLTFFCCHVSDFCKTIINTEVIKSRLFLRTLSNSRFFWAALTRELKISMASSL